MNNNPNGETPKKRHAARRIPTDWSASAEIASNTAPQNRTASPTPVQQNRTASPTPVQQNRTALPNTAPQNRTASPNTTPQNRTASPTSVQQNRTASPTPVQQNRTASPTPVQQNRTASPTPVQQNRTASPTSVQQNRTTSPNTTPQKQTMPQSSVRGIEYVKVAAPASATQGAKSAPQPVKNAGKAVVPVKKAKKPKVKIRYEGQSTLTSLIKAIMYIILVMVIAGFASYYIIMVGNDVFAFVKDTGEVEVSLPENATIDDIAELLYEKNIIKYPSIFKFYTQLRRKDLSDYEYVAGDHVLSPSMNYDYLFKAFLPVNETKVVRITIPEGYTVDEIIELFLSYGIGTREEFINTIQNDNFDDYWFIKELDENISPDRKYRLEGYLFPDTYEFYTTSSTRTVIMKLLDNFESKFDVAYKERCETLNMSVDDVIILASMIQMEAKYAEEYGAISSVFHNRLNSDAFMRRLDSDATIQYALGADRKTELTHEDTQLVSPYNTYLNSGLPPGPISNPSLNAISYAMYPDKTEYYYFVAQPNGYSLFARTEAEHLANINIARGNT